MRQLPVPPPYTPDDLQAIADALGLPSPRLLWAVALPCPGAPMVMGEPSPPGPLDVTLYPLATALQESARDYLMFLRHPAPRGSRGSGRAVLTRMGSTVKRIRRDLESLTADFQALDSETYMALTASSLTQYEQLRHLETWAGTQGRGSSREASVASVACGGCPLEPRTQPRGASQ